MAFVSPTCEPLRIWSRLEPRARQVDFADTLGAAIADPMFMLARQWQFGEFTGTDAGSAIFATLAREIHPLTVRGAGEQDGLDSLVERLPISFPLVVRARLGRAVLSRIEEALRVAGIVADEDETRALRELFYRFYGPVDTEPTELIHAARDRTMPRAVRARQALVGRSVDGVRVYELTPPDLTVAMLPAEFTAGLAPAWVPVVREALLGYRSWFESTYAQPGAGAGEGSHWESDQLEYSFAGTLSRPGSTTTIEAAEHVGGHLDWYSFDQGETVRAITAGSGDSVVDVRSVIPLQAEYPGMPKPRWWQFEDAAVDLGALSADATDVARIVVSEFALLYSNDWFTVVCRQPVGTVAELKGVVVTDTFGWRTLVLPTVAPAGANWTQWDVFSLSQRSSGVTQAPLPPHLVLARTLTHIMDGEPLEQVVFVRDETADMVWAIEQRVPDGLDTSRDAAEASRRMRRYIDPAADAAPSSASAGALRYTLQTEVAENWIPFIPVHIDGQLRAIQLQRGALRRTIGDQDTLIRPVTSILRQGIDDGDNRVGAYYVHEEEVPRAGVKVQGLLRRARRYDGTPVVWHARRVTTGRGEARSGLAFDRIT